MIHDKDQAMDWAKEMDEPVAVFDPAGGSLSGRFFLVEWEKNGQVRPTQMHKDAVMEITRKCFNDMRDAGMLDTLLDNRRKFHPQCQAWPVVTE